MQMEPWKGELQSFVDHVVRHVYLLPVEDRTMLQILEAISTVRPQLQSHLFPSNGCYYISLAQIIDHLMQHMQGKGRHLEKEWICTFWEMYDEARDTHLQLDHVIIQQSSDQFSVQKYFVHQIDDQVEEFIQSVIQWSRYTFQQIPDVIESIVLSTGKSVTYWPEKSEFST